MEHIFSTLKQIKENCRSEIPTSNQRHIPTTNDEMELKKQDKLRMLGLANLDFRFNNYYCPPGDKNVKKAFEGLACGNIDKPFLLCYGGVGNGKTHLIKATILELYIRGIIARYMTVADWMNNLRYHIEPPPGFEHLPEYLSRIVKISAMILDDMGVEDDTNWVLSQLEFIINYRYDRRLITIMATNKNLDELPERIRSRFSDNNVSQLVLNKSEDYRTRRQV